MHLCSLPNGTSCRGRPLRERGVKIRAYVRTHSVSFHVMKIIVEDLLKILTMSQPSGQPSVPLSVPSGQTSVQPAGGQLYNKPCSQLCRTRRLIFFFCGFCCFEWNLSMSRVHKKIEGKGSVLLSMKLAFFESKRDGRHSSALVMSRNIT